MTAGPYTKTGRLADVLALIQVLAFDENTHRSIAGIQEELQTSPTSGESWSSVAGEHPEFFRVRKEAKRPLSLVARHVLPEDIEGRRPISPELAHRLLETAIDLHDRQVSAAERWKSFVPLWSALIGGVFGTGSALLTLWFKGCPR
jgi:hypothetical protein